MATRIGKGVFFHVPKTAGKWIYHVVSVLSLDTEAVATQHNFPSMVPPSRLIGRFKFCFVRHPVEWYRSYWAFCREKGKSKHWYGDNPGPLDAIDDCYLAADSFADFINKAVKQCPGFVSDLYASYTSEVDFVGRYETLLVDLIYALERCQVSFRPSALDLLAKQRVNQTGVEKPELPFQLLKLICQSEKKAIRQFYHEYPAM